MKPKGNQNNIQKGDGEIEKVDFRYTEKGAPHFYVHGARGGPTENYDIRIDFYREEKRLPTREIVDLKTREQNFTYKDEESGEGKYTIVVDRITEVSIFLSVRACEELISWLMKKVEEVKQRTGGAHEKPRENEEFII